MRKQNINQTVTKQDIASNTPWRTFGTVADFYPLRCAQGYKRSYSAQLIALRRGPGRGRGRSVLVVTSTAAVLPPFLGWRTMLTRRPRARASDIATAIAVLGGQDLERLLPRPPRADQVRDAGLPPLRAFRTSGPGFDH